MRWSKKLVRGEVLGKRIMIHSSQIMELSPRLIFTQTSDSVIVFGICCLAAIVLQQI